ncbi:MAG: hypothetical protein EBU90_06395 [Proteobacteria bacterium]|nr:hypothetical protein [Pseudomonadota bacterium]NBP13547.1 hypothetical protein [bacterium]
MPNVFDSSSAAVGSIQASMLTEAEFQSIFGTGWVLARGQNVSGSKYASIKSVTTVPDLRGVFLRGKNNGSLEPRSNPDGDSSLGTYQADQFQSHQHVVKAKDGVDSLGGVGYLPQTSSNYGPSNTLASDAAYADNSGGNETRVKNVTVNYFIRIN